MESLSIKRFSSNNPSIKCLLNENPSTRTICSGIAPIGSTRWAHCLPRDKCRPTSIWSQTTYSCSPRETSAHGKTTHLLDSAAPLAPFLEGLYCCLGQSEGIVRHQIVPDPNSTDDFLATPEDAIPLRFLPKCRPNAD